MGGAYVAKPAVPTEPDVPPGWDPDWDFPGPNPPGYEPEYSLNLSAQSQMIPGVTVDDISLFLADHDTYETREPQSHMIWSAIFGDSGDIVQMKLLGGGAYQDSVDASYILGDVFYESNPDFDFDVSASDIGRIVILNVNSTPFENHQVESAAEITVVTAAEPPEYPEGGTLTFSATMSVSASLGEPLIEAYDVVSVTAEISIVQSSVWAGAYANFMKTEVWDGDERWNNTDGVVPGGADYTTSSSNGDLEAKANELENGKFYFVKYDFSTFLNGTTSGTATLDLSLTVDKGNGDPTTITKQIEFDLTKAEHEGAGGDTGLVTWCYIRGTSGEIVLL